MTTVVIGAGFLGNRLAAALRGARLVRTDITDRDAVDAALNDCEATAVINCAGKTGRPNVDWCEQHREATYRANVIGALVLADACAKRGAYLLHVGSGCIFDGASPDPVGWREDDAANPRSFYARTKYAADLVLSCLPDVGIVRLRMPIDDVPGERNLITKLASYRQVIDVENSVTVIDDFVEVVRVLLDRRATGVFHATNPGTIRHRELLRMYREIVDAGHRYELIGEGELVARGLALAPRSNCQLASRRLGELGIGMRPVEVAVREALVRYRAAGERRSG
jgi:3,5-epimerase/4-reductase